MWGEYLPDSVVADFKAKTGITINHTKIGDKAINCEINGTERDMQSKLFNGDVIKIITGKKVSPSLHWVSTAKTGKARAAIRRYWQNKEINGTARNKEYKAQFCEQSSQTLSIYENKN